MRKIMFNDKYGLTKAVLEGRKTMTRRMVCTKDVRLPVHLSYDIKTRQLLLYDACLSLVERSRYAFDEVVAIAQCYYNVYGYETCISERGEKDSGIFNKMFVRAESMPHHIKITNIYVERLQDISDEDCLREGVDKYKNGKDIIFMVSGIMQKRGIHKSFRTPREAFAALIDYVSGKGTWQSNPFVWVYEFELVD